MSNGPGSNVTDFYKFCEVIGAGDFGTIHASRCSKTGKEVVIKEIKRTQVPRKRPLSLEGELHADLDHPHICQVYETFLEDDRMYIVMEHCRGGELGALVPFRDSLGRRVFEQIVHAVSYMHFCGIAHRDLKLENFLIFEEGDAVVKLIDFGLAKRFQRGKASMTTACGSVPYMAPEVVSWKTYSEKCDVFSLGVVLYAMMTSRLPFYGKTDEVTMRKIRTANVKFSPADESRISQEGRDLIVKLLEKDPAKRLSSEEASKAQWLREAREARLRSKELELLEERQSAGPVP